MNNKIVVVGSANIDMVVKSDRFPEPGETILGGNFFMNPGGKGANQAVAAARLGGNVSFMCRVGDDEFGKRSREGYKEEGIITDHIVIDPERPTGVALISVNGDGENKIIVAPGANEGFTAKEIESVGDTIAKASILVMQLEIPIDIVGRVIRIAGQHDTKVILNPAPAQSLPDWYYENLFLITPNETETENLTGIVLQDNQSIGKAAKWFREKGVLNVVITMGKKGAFLAMDGFSGIIPTPVVEAVDTTAAGDVFNGALAAALARSIGLKDAVQFANEAATLSVKKIGAQNSCPTQKEVNEFKSKLTKY